jgi:hypothetical protein
VDECLRDEILRRSEADQAARRRVIELTRGRAFAEPPSGPALEAIERMRAVDEDNTAWMRGVVRGGGWPRRSQVGDAAAQAAWLLVQHDDHDPGFQRECLELLRGAVAAGEASAANLAYLTDRVLRAEGRPQRYGTQFTTGPGGLEPQPLEEPERVDELRAGVGLGPLADYARQMRERYGTPEE